MRNIKFRAWDKDYRKMCRVNCIDIRLKRAELYWFDGVASQGLYWETFDNLIFMQFTGLLDKNGKEIYEGDIVKILYSGKWKVLWLQGAFRIQRLYCDDGPYPLTRFAAYLNPDCVLGLYKVIGNIHEDPEDLPKFKDIIGLYADDEENAK